MKVNFKRLLSCLLAVLMVVASFTFTAAAASYADVSTVTSAAISEIKVNEPLDYKVGKDIVFKFQIKSGSTVVTAPYIYYSAAMDDGRTLTGYVAPVDGAYTVTLEGGLLRPGFVLMTVKACDSSKANISYVTTYTCGAGADVDKIQSIYGMPDEYSTYGDFDAFWETTLASLGEANISYIYDCGDYTFDGVTYDCYELEIACAKDSNYKDSWGGDNHVMAYLTIPQGKTNLGAQVLYKGYDWISASGAHDNIEPQSGICNANKITLSVSPHSIPAPHNVAEADKESAWVKDNAYIGNYYKASSGGYLYDTYGYSKNHGKNEEENKNPNTTYFKYMLMRDVQAVNFLKLYFGSTVAGYESWAGIWDGENILTNGASQGGYQALAVAGLVPEVNSVTAGVPWFADQGVTSADSDRYKPTSPRNIPYGEGLRYVDTANLAARISTDCNVTINAGLIDTLVPPSTVMSIYANLDCNVSLTFHQNKGHSTGGTVIYTQTISKAADTAAKSHTINYVSDFSADFKADFENAWENVCDDNVVTVDIYAVDKNTDIDFKALATSSAADAIGIVLTGDGLTNINAKLAEIYALHNDVNSKVWVIENDNALDGENAAITLDACMNWGDRPTGSGAIKLYTADGELGQTSVLGANVNCAVIPTPLWVSAQGILVDTNNVTFENGKLSTNVDEASIKFTSPAFSATYNMTGVGDAAAYGNIDGVGLWVVENDGTLTIKGSGAIPAYASYSATPWANNTVTKIVVTDGITSIGANALASSGATVNLPLSVAEIANGAISADATIVSYENAYAYTYATENSIKFTNLGATGSAGTNLTWILDANGVLTIDGTGTKTYSGSEGWSSDGSKEKKSVFYPYRNRIKTIKFGDSVTTIGSKTFYFIAGLTTVELTPNIKTIGDNAFGNCANLSTIYVKGNEPVVGTYDLSNVTSMTGGYQFDGSGKTTLKEVKLSNNLTGGLADKFISYNSTLTSITIPAGVTSFSSRTLHQCSALKEITFLGNTTIPDSFLFHKDEQKNSSDPSQGYKTYIDVVNANAGTSAEAWVKTANAKYADLGISHRITFNASVVPPTATGKAGENLTWKIMNEDGEYVMYIQGTGTYIQPYITASQTFDTSIAWNEDHSQYDWKDYASSIKKLVIEAPVTKVLGYTFSKFDNCHTLELPTSMTTLSNQSCFNDMDKLVTIYTKGQTPEVGTANLSNITKIEGYALVKTAFKKVILKENVQIDNYAFVWNVGLESVELPEGVKLGSHVFGFYTTSNKNKLRSITFPESMSNVPYESFMLSDNNSTFSANNYVTTITIKNPNATFGGATADAPYTAFLNNFTALNTVYGYSGSTAEAMVTWANANGRSIEFVSLGGNTVASGEYQGAKWTVTGIDGGKYSVTIDGTITALPNASSDWGLDAYKANVTEVIIKAPITSITSMIKDMFVNVAVIELPTSCKTIGGSAFNGNKKLATIYTTGQDKVVGTFNLSNITFIGGWSLVMNAMDTIIFGEGVEISDNALYWSPNLKNIVFPNTIKKLGNNSLVTGTNTERQWKVSEVTFPAGWNIINAKAFVTDQTLNDPTPNTTLKTITVENPNAVFVGAWNANATTSDFAAFVTGNEMAALTTVKGKTGSTAEELVNWANEYFAENNIDRTIEFVATDAVASGMPIGENLWFRILDDGNGKYIFDIYGTGTKAQAMSTSGEYLSGGYANFVEKGAYKTTNYYQYLGKVSKIKFSAPNVTTITGYLFQAMGATVVELHTNMTSISQDAFNGLTTLTTVYTTGQTPVDGVANLTNVSSIGGYVFYQNKFVKILLNENLTSIGKYTFGNASKLEVIEIPAKVTQIDANAFINATNLKYISFGADSFTYSSSAFTGINKNATVGAKPGSRGETFASELGLQFIDSSKINDIVATYSNNNSVILLDKVDVNNITAYATGSATDFSFGYTSWANSVNGTAANRPWNDYKSLITKVVFVNPNLTKFDASFAVHRNLKTVEIPASVKAVGSNALNGDTSLKTLYIAGNEIKEGVVDLSNVTSLGDMCMASVMAHTILLSDNLTGSWGNNLFYQCMALEYLRIPAGVTSISNDPFFKTTALTTVLVENPNLAIPTTAFANSTKLTTIIGYKGSKAEEFANTKGLEFIALDETDELLRFEGYEIRERGYNGLRSIFSASVDAMDALEAKGLNIVEFGSLLASTDKLNAAAVELTIAKNSEGVYESHSFAKVAPIYQNGVKVGKTLTEDEINISYACTVTNFSEDNYTKNVTFRGYIVYEDKEGNDFIVYADLIGDDGQNYNSTNLEAVCQGMINDGRDLSTNVCWLDILKFRENLVK